MIVGRRLGFDAGYLLPVVLGARRAVHDETLAPFAALHELCVRIRVGEVEQAEDHVRFRARRITSAVVRVRSWKQATCHVLSLDRVNLQPGYWLTLPLNLMSRLTRRVLILDINVYISANERIRRPRRRTWCSVTKKVHSFCVRGLQGPPPSLGPRYAQPNSSPASVYGAYRDRYPT